MNRINRFFTVFLLLLLSACSSISTISDYEGRDAGRLIISMSTNAKEDISSYDNYFVFKSKSTGEQDGKYFLFFTPCTGSILFCDKTIPDFKNTTEQGVVLDVWLPPGDYEILNTRSETSRVSIPFTVKPNQITYLGSYHSHLRGVYHKQGKAGAQGYYTYKGYYLVSDQLSRDIDIVKKRDAKFFPTNIINSTPKSSTNPVIVIDSSVK